MFIKRLATVGISGVSRHSYRYSWAERAKEASYLERFAMQALGHSSNRGEGSRSGLDAIKPGGRAARRYKTI
jgi:integrase